MMENKDKNIKPDQSNNQSPDLNKANEEYSRDLENSELGTEMLDYGHGGPGESRDDSAARSKDSTSGDKEPGGSSDRSAGTLD